MDAQKQADRQKVALQEAFHFTEEDLAANRSGQLSERQRGKLQLKQQFGACGCWMVIFMLALPTCAGKMALLNAPSQMGLYATIVICLVWVFYNQRQAASTLLENRAERARGYLHPPREVHTEISTKYKAYEMTVGNRAFIMHKSQCDLLTVGREYTFYYIPESNHLLSLELTEEAEAAQKRQHSQATHPDKTQLDPAQDDPANE